MSESIRISRAKEPGFGQGEGDGGRGGEGESPCPGSSVICLAKCLFNPALFKWMPWQWKLKSDIYVAKEKPTVRAYITIYPMIPGILVNGKGIKGLGS